MELYHAHHSWGFYLLWHVSGSLPACVTLNKLNTNPWNIFSFPASMKPNYCKTRLIPLDLFSIQAPTYLIVILECADYPEVHHLFFSCFFNSYFFIEVLFFYDFFPHVPKLIKVHFCVFFSSFFSIQWRAFNKPNCGLYVNNPTGLVLSIWT